MGHIRSYVGGIKRYVVGIISSNLQPDRFDNVYYVYPTIHPTQVCTVVIRLSASEQAS